MAKFTLAFAVLFAAALMSAASASAYMTVVTTTVAGEEENPERGCEREVRQFRMRHCVQWMRSMTGPYEESFLRSAVANPQYEEEHLQECCSELRSVSSPCRCEAIRHMMRRMQEEHGMEEEMRREMMQRAESLPRMCRMRSPTQCRIRPIFA